MAVDAAVEELSLCGLLSRLELVERYRGISKPSEEEQAVISAEGAVKKRVAETLGELSAAGLTSAERKGAVNFLEGQLKSAEGGTKAADARKAKLEELLSGIRAAASVEEPAHVQRAKKEVARAEKDFEAVHKEFALWEKGKKMLGVDELNKLKRSHEDGLKILDAAKALVQEQLCRRPEAAAALPSVLAGGRPSAAAAPGRAKAGANSVRGGGPAVRRAPTASSAAGGYPAGPSAAALRQAHLVADVRAETAWPAPELRAPAEKPAPPRPRPQPREIEADVPKVVLSYSCTCAAVAEVLRISKEKAADLAESSKEFASHLTHEQWEQVQQRSVEIEKQNREQQREKEKRRQDKALAKISGAAPSAAASATGRSSVGAVSPFPAAGPPPAAAKAKAKPKAKAAAAAPPKKKGGLGAHAHGTTFSGLGGDSDSDDGDGWTTVA